MRPIKYRAWDKTEKKMYDLRDMYFNVSIDHPRVVFEMPFEMVDEDWKDHDLVLLEFTGLTDRNGTEIYEGDIIHSGNNKELSLKGRRGYVTFEDGCFEVERRPHKVPYNHDKYLPYLDWPSEAFEGCEVVGNIYENPGLLKGE